MARKKLLTEGEIRQFMKLANLRPVNEVRLTEMGGAYPGQRDEEDPMAMGDEMPPEEGVPGDPMGDPEADMEMDAEMDMGAEEGGGDMVSMEDFMTALEQAIEEVTGEEADVSEEPGEEGEEEVGMEMDMEMGPEGGEEMEMGEEEIVAEILRRLREDKPFTAKKEKPGADIRKGAEKRGAEGTKKKTSGKGHGEAEGEDAYVNELEAPSAHAARSAGRRTPRKLRTRRRGDEEGEFGAVGPVLTGTESEMEDPVPYDPEEEEELSQYGGRGSFKGRRPPTGVGIPGITSEQLVNTVAKRVAARLKAESRKAHMVDTLAERIMHRLTK